MKNVLAVLFAIAAVFNVIEAVTIGVTGEGNTVSVQLTDQIIIALFFASIAIREYAKGRN